MNKGKKLSALFVAVVMIINMIPFVAFSAEATGASNQLATELFQTLGAFDGVTFTNYPENITPENFDKIMTNLIGYDSGISQMSLVSPQLVNLSEAVKVVVDLLGYQSWAAAGGGFPVGYMDQAAKLKILKNVNLTVGQSMTYNSLLQLLYNSLDVEVLKVVSTGPNRVEYGTNRGVTFATEVLKIKKVEGVLDGNNVTTLIDPVGVGKNTVTIDGVAYTVNSKTKRANDLIGHNVLAYYSLDDEVNDGTNPVLLFARDSGKYTSEIIQARNVANYAQGILSYYAEDTGKERTIDISGVPVVYNHVLVNSYGSEAFDIKKGQIEIIDGKNGYQAVLITNIVDMVVGSIDSSSRIICDRLYGVDTQNANNTLQLDDNPKNIIEIVDVNGAPLKFSDIALDDVLSVVENGYYKHVVVSRKQLKNFVVTYVNLNEEEVIYSNGKEEYQVSPYLMGSKEYRNIQVGDLLNVVLSADNQIIWYLAGSTTGLLEGYVVKTGLTGGVSPRLQIKIFTSAGKMVTLDGADKILFEDAFNAAAVRLSGEEVFARASTYEGVVVKYLLNSEGQLKQLSVPLFKGPEMDQVKPSRSFQIKMADLTNETYQKYGVNVETKYRTGARTFGGKLYLKSNAYIYSVPSEPELADDEDYEIKTLSVLEDDLSYPGFTAYTGKNTDLADCLVMVNQNKLEAKMNAAVVISISQMVDSSGNEFKRIIGFESGARVVLDSYVGSNGKTAFDEACDLTDVKANNHVLEPGDIFRYQKGGITGTVKKAFLLFDANGYNAGAPQTLGVLAGTNGMNIGTTKGGIPVGLNYLREPDGGMLTLGGGYYRVMCGWVYSRNGSLLTITSQDVNKEGYLPEKYIDRHTGAPSPTNPGHIMETYNFGLFFTQWPTSKIVTVDLTGPEVYAKEAKLSDVRAYKEAAGAASRLISIVFWGEPVQMFVINGEIQ